MLNIYANRYADMICVNDLHIIAHARSEGFILLSNSLREF